MNFVRLRMPRLASRLALINEFCFERHLLLTNTAICAVSNMIADAVVQHASGWRIKTLACSTSVSAPTAAASVVLTPYQSVQNSETEEEKVKPFEWRRNLRLGAVGVALAPMCHYWYIYLDRWFVGKSAPAIVKKLLMDTGVFSPIYIVCYHAALTVLDGESWGQLRKMLRNSGVSLFSVECVTLPFQAINFIFVPIRFRVLFDNVLSFTLDMTYSHFVHKDFDDDQES